jgi:sugar lactone lactonase YvrE
MTNRVYGPDAGPQRYPDPDVVVLDPRFARLKIDNTAIQRLWTGALWAEGPAWNGVGRYLVWSDIPNNIQLRWLQDGGHVSVFRSPSANSNGNTFDWQGRQLSCEHLNRRVVRYEHDGSLTVIAHAYNGQRFNSANDVVAHPDGSVWFTDPPYGTRAVGGYEGEYGELFLKPAVYRADPTTGELAQFTDDLDEPNGLCFTPDYRGLYVVDTGKPRDVNVFDVLDQPKPRPANVRQFTDMRGWRVGRAGWLTRRHRRQRLGGGLGRAGLRRCAHLCARRRTHRAHPSAGGLRERLLRWPEAQSSVHDRQPIGVCPVSQYARRACGITHVCGAGQLRASASGFALDRPRRTR